MSTRNTTAPPHPVVLVHGMWSCRRTWGATADVLQQNGHTVLPYELPEHGLRSSSPRKLGLLGVADYVDDLVNWVRQQPRPPILTGHSMGGLVSLLAAAELKRQGCAVPGVILVTPATPAGALLFSMSNLLVFLRPTLTQLLGWRAFTLSNWEARFGLYHGVDTARQDGLLIGLQAESGKALMEIAFWFLNPKPTTRVNWSDLSCPVRVYLGGRDRIVPTRAAHVFKPLKDLWVDIEPESTHMVFDDPNRDRFFSWLIRRLADLNSLG